MIELLLLLITVLLILACGLFVAAEFALLAVNRTTVERLADKGDASAEGVLRALRTLSTQLSSAQVGITITNLAIGFLAEPVLARMIEPTLLDLGMPEASVSPIAFTIGLIISTALTMVFGELVPKNLAISKPLTTAKFIQRPLHLFTNTMAGPIRTLNGSANYILRQFGVSPQEELASARSADELLSLVRRSAAHGTLEKETAAMLERSLNFGDLTALDVMTPRVRVNALQIDMPVTEAITLAKKTGFSRFPVYKDSFDNIVGILHIKHALGVERDKRRTMKVEQIMRPPILVPSTIELEPLLQALRKGSLQMAIVIDEFGGCDGIVTMEDLLEEIVGEVHDEHDRAGSPIRKRGTDKWQISGLLRPDEIGEELGIYLPEEDEVETVGGLILHHLERIPEVKDHTQIKAIDRNGDDIYVQLTVERMDGNRIDRVLLRRINLTNKEGQDS